MFARILTVSNQVRVAMWRKIPGDTVCVPIEVFANETLTVVTRGSFLMGASVLLEGSNDGKKYFPIKDAAGFPVLRKRVGVQHIGSRPRYVRPSVVGCCEEADIDIHLIIHSTGAE